MRRALACLIPSLLLCPGLSAASLGETSLGWEGDQFGKELQFIAFFFSRGEVGNIFATNDFLSGQTVGRLYGPNTTTSSNEFKTFYFEQRLLPFIIYEPRVLNGFARLRASFELDWTMGDLAYSTGGNFGGAFGADQVNIQTQNVQIELQLHRDWYLDVGLQRLYDNPRDLYRTMFSTLSLTGQRLAFWGSDAAGAVLHGRVGNNKLKFGAYQLFENQPQDRDDVTLFEAAWDRYMRATWHIGASVRYVRDTASGEGGTVFLSQGFNSGLADYDGAYRFPLGATRYRADVFWLGADTSFNPEFHAGPIAASSFLVANLGRLCTEIDASALAEFLRGGDRFCFYDPGKEYFEKASAIRGVAADLRLGVRYGNSSNDHVTLEALYTTGDNTPLAEEEASQSQEEEAASPKIDALYTGVVTGNTWAPAGAPFGSHGMYILLPHLNVVNRFVGAVSDISNMGYGLAAGMLNVSKDLVRNRLQAKLGAGAARAAKPPVGGGYLIGYEVNGMLSYRPKAFFTIGLHGAYMVLGDFYKSPDVLRNQGNRPDNPWLCFVTLSWLMF